MIDFHPHGFTLPRHTIDGVEQDFYETATLQDNLDHSGGITVSWKSKTDEEIPLGAYITYNGIRYVLIDQYAPSKENAFSFKYDVLFRHPQNMLDRIPFWVKSKDSSGGDLVLRTSSFTGFPHTIAQKLVDFFAEYANETGDTFFAETIGLELEDDSEVWDAETNPWVTTWGINIPTTNDSAIITVGFDKSSLKSLANSIADAMGCNVFWNWNTKTIEFIAGTTITGEAYNCFHVLGGTTNMGKVTASGGYAAITQRLALADPVEGQDVFWVTDRYGRQRKYRILKGSIISGAAEGEMMLTKDLIFDDIYPKMELFIKTSRQRLCYLTDENGDFIVDQMFYYYMNGETKVYTELAYKTDGKDYDSEGRELTEEPTFKMFAKWYVSLAYDRELTRDYMFDQSKLIDDQPLSMLFQIDLENADDMSKLVGRQFELTYFPDDKKEWDKTDTVSYDNAFEAHKGEFRIAFVAEGEVLLPSVGTWTVDAETHEGYWAGLCPNVGDKVTLVNMALTDEVSFAKEDLLNAAKEIIGLMNAPAGEYTEQMVFNNPSERVSIGDPSPFNTPGRIQHGPVVTAITHNLDTDVADVTAGAWSRKTKTGGTADKLEVVTVSASASTIGGDKYGDGVIGEGYYTGTKQKEIETIQQTQLKPDGAYSAILSSTQSVLNCDEDGKVVAGASGVNLYTKIGAYYGTRDVTDTSSVTLNNVLIGGVTVWLQTSNTGADTSKQLRPNATEALGDEDRYWLRINVPNGYDLNEPLSISFSINQIAYDSRVLTYEISGVRASGGGSADGRFQSRVFARTNTDLSRAVVTGGSYSSPYPTETRINNQVVAVTWEDGIPQGKAVLWSTIRWFYPDLTTDSWRTPAAETDTQTQDIEFAFEQSGGAQPAEPDDTNRHGGSGTQIWFDPVLDAEGASGSGLPSGHHWDEMVWRAEQKIENGEAVGEWAITRIKGEKGNGIVSITRTFAISNVGTTSSETTEPSHQGDWSAGSPAVTEQYPYLWAKEVVVFTDTTKNTTKYYCIGARGDNGVDAQDIEWVYIRTKTPIAPVIDSDDTYTDHNGKTYSSDDHLPKVVPGSGGSASDIESDNSGTGSKPYECTDDTKGVGDTWKYEWEIKRSKGAATNGKRSWKYYGEDGDGKMTLHNNYAESAFIIDTDNDNDQFGTDSESKVLVSQSRSTKVTIYDGSTPQTLASLNIELKYEDGTAVPTTVATYTATANTGVVAVTILQNTSTPFSHDEIQATITASVTGKGSKSTVFTIRKVMSGQPGLSPTIYQLAPTQKTFSFYRDSSNNILPASQSSQINVAQTIGNTTTILSTAQTGMTYKWGFDDSTTAVETGKAIGTSIQLPVSDPEHHYDAISHYQIWVQLMHGNTEGDIETLPIVKDGAKGADGTSPWVADLNNEMDSVSCDETGYVLMPANQTTVAVRTAINLHYGSTAQKFKITDIKRNNAAIAANSGVTVSPVAPDTQRDSGLVFTVTYGIIGDGDESYVGNDKGKTAKISGKDDFAITIQSVDTTFTQTLHFIVNGAIGDVYNLMPSVDEIHAQRNADGSYVVDGYSYYWLTCGYTTNKEGTITEHPDTNATTITGKIDSKYNIYHRLHNRANNTWSPYYLYTGNKSQVTGLDLDTYDAVEFILCTNTTNTTSVPVDVIDRETVHVIADGEAGPQGIEGPQGQQGIEGPGLKITLDRDGYYSEANWNTWAAIGNHEYYTKQVDDEDIDFTTCRINDFFKVSGVAYDSGIKHTAEYRCTAVTANRLDGICISHITDGEKGANGSTGAMIRGPRKWDDYVEGGVTKPGVKNEQLYCGASGEPYLDIVTYNPTGNQNDDHLYQCIQTHGPNHPHAPSDTNYWVEATKYDFIATNLLYSLWAEIENLQTQRLLVTNGGNIEVVMEPGTPFLVRKNNGNGNYQTCIEIAVDSNNNNAYLDIYQDGTKVGRIDSGIFNLNSVDNQWSSRGNYKPITGVPTWDKVKNIPDSEATTPIILFTEGYITTGSNTKEYKVSREPYPSAYNGKYYDHVTENASSSNPPTGAVSGWYARPNNGIHKQNIDGTTSETVYYYSNGEFDRQMEITSTE